MPITFTNKGTWEKTTAWMKSVQNDKIFATLDQFGQVGVAALIAATPVDTSITAQSWYHEVVKRKGYYSIRWRNRHVVDGVPIAIILQYGHGTRQGGYVEGRDYIMPAIRPVFDQIEAEVRRVVNG